MEQELDNDEQSRKKKQRKKFPTKNQPMYAAQACRINNSHTHQQHINLNTLQSSKITFKNYVSHCYGICSSPPHWNIFPVQKINTIHTPPQYFPHHTSLNFVQQLPSEPIYIRCYLFYVYLCGKTTADWNKLSDLQVKTETVAYFSHLTYGSHTQ